MLPYGLLSTPFCSGTWTELNWTFSKIFLGCASGGWVTTRLLARQYFIEFIRRAIFKLYELKLALAEVFLWPQQNYQCKISSNKHKVFTAETVSKKRNRKTTSLFVSFSHSSFRDVIPVTVRKQKVHSCYIWKGFNIIAIGKTQCRKKERKKEKKERCTDRREMTICTLLFYSEAVHMLNGNLFKTEEHFVWRGNSLQLGLTIYTE